MAKVNVEPDCGNAPKKLFIRDFMIALANEDMTFILDTLADNIHWETVGSRSVSNKVDVEKFLNDMLPNNVKEMTLTTIITHGDAGSVNGTMILSDGNQYGFCHVFTFGGHGKNAKVKAIMSYLIEGKR